MSFVWIQSVVIQVDRLCDVGWDLPLILKIVICHFSLISLKEK